MQTGEDTHQTLRWPLKHVCVRYQKVFSSPVSIVAIPALQAVPGSRQAEVNGWSHQLLFSYRNPCHKMLQMLNASGQMHWGLLGAKMPLLAHRVPNSQIIGALGEYWGYICLVLIFPGIYCGPQKRQNIERDGLFLWVFLMFKQPSKYKLTVLRMWSLAAPGSRIIRVDVSPMTRRVGQPEPDLLLTLHGELQDV